MSKNVFLLIILLALIITMGFMYLGTGETLQVYS